MVDYDQRNPHHCYDLFLHVLHTVQFVGSNSPTPLLVAAFFHDIGKPYVAQEKQGRLVFMDMHRNHLRLQDRYFTVLDTPDCKLTIFASTLAITMILFLGFFLQSHMTVKILI